MTRLTARSSIAATAAVLLSIAYLAPITSRVAIQPDLQYVIHPDSRRTTKNALVASCSLRSRSDHDPPCRHLDSRPHSHSRMALQTGDVRGHYRIEALLGNRRDGRGLSRARHATRS